MQSVSYQAIGFQIAAPAANQSLLNSANVTNGVLPVSPGLYIISVAAFFTGTVATPNDGANIQLYADGQPVPGAVILRAGAGAQAGDPDNAVSKIAVQVTANLELRAIAAASAGALYNVKLVAMPVSSAGQLQP